MPLIYLVNMVLNWLRYDLYFLFVFITYCDVVSCDLQSYMLPIKAHMTRSHICQISQQDISLATKPYWLMAKRLI